METKIEEQIATAETATEPQATEVTPSKPTPMTSSELKELQSLVKEVTSTFKNMEAMTKSCFDSAGVSFESISILESLIKHPRENNSGSEDTQGTHTRRVTKFPLEDHAVRANDTEYGKTPESYVYDEDIQQVLGDAYVEGDDDKNMKTFNNVFQVAAQYISIRDALIGIQNEYREEVQKQYNYMTSPEFAKEQEERLKAMEQRYEEETDEETKKALGHAIAAIKSMNSMDYIFKRLEGETAKKEVDAIASNFFEARGSKYVLSKFAAKAKKLGIAGDMYLNCLNIETRFLDEMYHPFNNLFLFSMVRLIAYIDTYNKDDAMFAKNTMRMLLRLMNHSFPTPEAEKAFINVIKTYLDHFMPMRDKFAVENDSYIKYVESIHMPEPACLDIDIEHTEADDSKWIINVADDDGGLYVISELQSDEGFKLFANGRAIIKPSEVPEEYRDKLAVLGDDGNCASLNVATSVVADAVGVAKATGLSNHIPVRPANIAPSGRINTKGLKTSRAGFSWISSVYGVVNVYVDGDRIWIDDYIVVNATTTNAPFTEVWLADEAGIIRTNISMAMVTSAIKPKPEEGDRDAR